MTDAFRLPVLNAGGRDSAQAFPDFAGAVDDRIHAPVNYHAYAACTGGAFLREESQVPAGDRAVLVLLRRDLKPALKAVRNLRARGHLVAISWKESGLHQIAAQLEEARNIELFRELCALAHGALSSTPDLVPLYRAAGAKRVAFIPTPYPVDDPRWDFSRPPAQRAGVFIGTREFEVPSRNHAAVLFAAKLLQAPITVVNPNGRSGVKQLAAFGISDLHLIEKRLPYAEYLREMARHRLVLQLDQSNVPGQVAGDALLARVPCVGGNGAIERLAFPEFSGHGRSPTEVMEIATRILADDVFAERAHAVAQVRALEKLSFAAGRKQLAAFFAELGA